jgi:hypothetical protein
MRIYGIRLPDAEVFPCSRRRVKEVFANDELEWVSFGNPIRSFRFDGRMTQRPRLVGPVVASLSIDRENSAHLCLYPVKLELYPSPAQAHFSIEVLPRLQRWLHDKQSRPETAIVGHEELLVEWTEQGHRHHELPHFL